MNQDKVRATVHDLADDARFPAGLAATARRQGRRIRRRRRAGVAAAALGLIAATSVPYLLLRSDEPSPQPQPAATTPAPVRLTTAPADWGKRPLELPGGVIVTALTRNDVGRDTRAGRTLATGNVVLDRKTGRYTALTGDYYTVWGAPELQRGVVNGNGGLGIIRADGSIVWADVAFALDPQWSPDGTRLLATTSKGFAVIDARTGDVRRTSTPDAMSACPDDCLFTWLPDGRRVAIAQRDLTVAQDEEKPDVVDRIKVYDVSTAKLLTTLSAPGVPAGQDAWSPDGGRVVLKHATAGGWGDRLIFDTATGKVNGTIAEEDVHFLPNGQVLGLNEADAIARLYDSTGRVLEEMTLPQDFAARKISIGTP